MHTRDKHRFSKERLAVLISEHSIPFDEHSRPHWLKIASVRPNPSGEAILARGKRKMSIQWSIVGGTLHFAARTLQWEIDSRKFIEFIQAFIPKAFPPGS
ncbi:MAG: hypothetical protein RLY57_456 [Candidatus Parcubacteria bacterium]|jgi:hypothetical protein